MFFRNAYLDNLEIFEITAISLTVSSQTSADRHLGKVLDIYTIIMPKVYVFEDFFDRDLLYMRLLGE